jgi:hypothetical protein
LPSAFLTVIGQLAQFIPGTERVTVFIAAAAGTASDAKISPATSFFMRISVQ